MGATSFWRFVLLFNLAAVAASAAQSTYPAPRNLGDPARLGLGIQRTMSLLAASTPERRATVRVLFYGQSITEQTWWKTVADDLRGRFPHANLVVENRALGGFASQMLVKSAETDLYPFYPDLVIFHVYGSHLEYENIIRRTRERTTAEILMQTDHATADENQGEESDPAKLQPSGKVWNSFMNYKFLPETASKYGCGLVDQRNLWKQYLKDYNLSARQLLRDNVHLSEHGCFLMAELVKAYLVRRPEVTIEPMNCEAVRTYSVGRDLKWNNGKLGLTFEGNRVDVVVKAGTGGPVAIRIDGRKPSEVPELYGLTRAVAVEPGTGRPRGKWPVVMSLGSEAGLLVEDWTMHARKEPGTNELYSFTAEGSSTGPDGAGRSDALFVSKSRRLVIEPTDWNAAYSLGLAGLKPVPADFVVRWQVVPWFQDEFVSPGVKEQTVETVVTVAQGLKNAKHTIEFTGGPDACIAALRVYRPPLRTAATP